MKRNNTNYRVLLYSSGRILEENPTGGEYRFLELADYFEDKFWADLCCADEQNELEKRGLHAAIRLAAPHDHGSFLPEEARIWLENRKELRNIARDGYDAVIAFDVPPAIGLVLSGEKNLVLMIRKDLIGYEKVKNGKAGMKRGIKLGYQWLCEELCLRRAAKIICQCQYDRDALLKRHPRLRRKLIPRFSIQINNVNPTWIVKRAEESHNLTGKCTVQDDKQNSKDVFRICFVGGFDDPRKGQDLLLKAAKHLSEKHSALRFVLIGGGRKLEQYRDEYQSEQITFLGRLENPVPILSGCDLAVVPSLADSCPNTMMEALYTGIPVIGSRAGGIPEILQDEEALFEPEWSALAEKIEKCYLQSEFYEGLGSRQRSRAKELTFNWAERISTIILEDR